MMRTQEIENRIIRDYNNWFEKEQRFEKLFNTNLAANKPFLKEKLAFLSSLPLKYRDTLNQEEKTAAKILQFEKSKLEKQLYPNQLFRLLNKVIKKIQLREEASLQQSAQEHNIRIVQHSITNLGFGDLRTQIKSGMRYGNDEFTIPVSHYFNRGESVNYELIIEKDLNGSYQVQRFKASLQNPEYPGGRREQIFSINDGITLSPSRTYNLLCGRAIQSDKSYSGSATVSLDFNDKDSEGNFRSKFYNDNYTSSLENMLNKLPYEILGNQQYVDSLKKSLSNGDLAEWLYIKDGVETKFYMEANPKLGEISFYDQHYKKTDHETILGKKVVNVTHSESLKNEKPKANLVKKSRNALSC